MEVTLVLEYWLKNIRVLNFNYVSDREFYLVNTIEKAVKKLKIVVCNAGVFATNL